jgi:hypothetical protein
MLGPSFSPASLLMIQPGRKCSAADFASLLFSDDRFGRRRRRLLSAALMKPVEACRSVDTISKLLTMQYSTCCAGRRQKAAQSAET